MEIMKFENFTYPRGWVNIKVDDDMYIRMARYVTILDKILIAQPNSIKRDKYDLQKKIDLLSNIDILISDKTISVKDKISLITILQYLNELRNNFNDSSAGFLLEGFLAALIHGKLVGGRDIADIEGKSFSDEEREKLKIQTLSKSYSELDVAEFESMPSDEDRGEKRLKYQIKLYAQDSNIKINVGKECDYYVICLKRLDRNIDVHIVKYEQIIDEKFAAVKKIGNPFYKLKGVAKDEYIKNNPLEYKERNIVTKQLRNTLKKYVEVNTKRLQDNNDRKVTLTISDLDKKIKDCAEEIKLLIDQIYLKISDLHFDIDSLVTGVDKNNKEISSKDAEASAILTIADITKHLTNLSKDI